jgi:hypothetical protein
MPERQPSQKKTDRNPARWHLVELVHGRVGALAHGHIDAAQ